MMNPKTCLILMMSLSTIVPESQQWRLPANYNCAPVESELRLFRAYYDMYDANITDLRSSLSFSLRFFNLSQVYLDTWA